MSQVCCICIDIRIGVWILAILDVVGGMYTTVQGGLFFLKYAVTPKQEEGVLDNMVLVTMGLQVPSGLVQFILGIVLTQGMHKREPKKIQLWVKCNIVLFVLAALQITGMALTFFILSGEMKDESGGFLAKVGLVLLILGAGGLSIYGYFIWVVKRYVRILQVEEDEINYRVTGRTGSAGTQVTIVPDNYGGNVPCQTPQQEVAVPQSYPYKESIC